MTTSVLVLTHCGKFSPHLHTHRLFFRCGCTPWDFRQTWQETLHRRSQYLTVTARRDLASPHRACARAVRGFSQSVVNAVTRTSQTSAHDSLCLTTQTWHTLLRAKKLGWSSGPPAVAEGNDVVGEVGDVWMAVVELRESVNLLGTQPPKTVTTDISGSVTSRPFKRRQGRKLLMQRR